MKLSLLGWACAGVILLGGSSAAMAAPAIDNGTERARPALVAGAADQGAETATFCLLGCKKDSKKGGILDLFDKKKSIIKKIVKKPDYKPTPKTSAVPELDPTAAGSALLLLIGGSLVLLDRKRAYQNQ